MSRKPAFFWWVIAVGAVLAVCYGAVGIQFWQHAREGKLYGYSAVVRGSLMEVNWIGNQGPSFGRLQIGDRILAINGYRGSVWILNRLILRAPIGGSYTATVLRHSKPVDVRLTVARFRVPPDWGPPMLLASSLACFALAMLMGLVKPADCTVQLGTVTFLVIAAGRLSEALEWLYWGVPDWARLLVAVLISRSVSPPSWTAMSTKSLSPGVRQTRSSV